MNDDSESGDRLHGTTHESVVHDEPQIEEGAQAGSLESGEQLHRIRQILFGTQVKQLTERLSQLEAQMNQRLDSLRTDLTQQVEAVETELMHRLEQTAQRLEQLDSVGEERVVAAKRDLQSEIGHEVRSLRITVENTLEQRVSEIQETISHEADQRKTGAATERANLSALFAELSERLGSSEEGNG